MTIKLDSAEWFDQRYVDGIRPRLEDKAELMRNSNLVNFSERNKKNIEKKLQEALFKLEQKEGYSPSQHVIAFELLTCLYPMIHPKPTELKSYIERYHKALLKHGRKIPLRINFPE